MPGSLSARTAEAINQAAKAGLRPLVKPVKPSAEIRSKFSVWQNRLTGEIVVLGDYRMHPRLEVWQQVIDWTFYYPHAFPEPFAAYLIPPDIGVGEQVYVEDLIEDFIGASWNQGCKYRLKSCTAVWNGTDLTIEYDRSKDLLEMMG